jgi:hypothetical protein
MFSPRAFLDGAMFYDLVTHVPPPSHLALSPFDLYREPLALIAIADGAEIRNVTFGRRPSTVARTVVEQNIRSLYQELEDLRDSFHKIIIHQVLIFDYDVGKDGAIPVPEGLITIPPAEQHKRTTMKTVMCSISSLLLAELTGLARSFDAMAVIDSPGQSSAIRKLNGSSWQEDEPLTIHKSSQYGSPTPGLARSSSASGTGDRSHVRMSMPPMPYKNSSPIPGRPSTPARSGLSNPPTTSEDITNAYASEPGSPEAARPGTAEGFRSQSQERVAVQGFGPGSSNERFRNKSKSRAQIVIGSLYLQAGRWPDAIKELSEAAVIARSINDHLWHGKALELTLVALVLLGWAGVEFQVPQVLLPPQEKGSGTSTPSSSATETAPPDQPRCLRNLQGIVPELLDRIIGLYSRISAEHLPLLPLSEAIIRFSKILAALHVADGNLVQQSLDMIVMGKLPGTPLTTSPRFTITPSRSHIITTLFRAFPGSTSELLTTVDRIVILGGIASVLGVLGYQRKKAMVVRELLSVLITGLIEARTRGAAEVGIHPAAGLVALNGVNGHSSGSSALQLGEGDIEYGVDAFLELVLRPYGVVSYQCDGSSYSSREADAGNDDKDDSATVERIQRQSAARAFGMRNIKLNMLRACINFSEALPDFGGVLRFSSDLLRTAGSGIAPGPRREDALPGLSKEEQVRLVTNISKTSNLAKRMGMDQLSADYWDEFLLREIKLEPLPATRTPIPHSKSILPDATTVRESQVVNPFIYNPFLKHPDKSDVEKILVAGEGVMFRLTLQNPYEIEVDVESVKLISEGVEFESSVESTLIGPYRTQILRVTGTAKTSGTIKITGAIIKIQGCKERRFPIFSNPWAPESNLKIKATGLAALEYESNNPYPLAQPLKADQLELKVISQQPMVVVKSTTLPQSSVMILEGERQSFSVTLQNLSTTPVDFLLFSFQDSTQEPLQTALNNREATRAELYEYELILAKKQALRLRSGGDKNRFIGAGETATFEFEILGKPGLTNGLIQIDYAYIGVPHNQVEEKFFTRQVSLELTVTVNASVDIPRIDILPLHGSIPQPLWTRTAHTGDSKELTADNYCLMMLDVRNAWPSNMLVKLEVENGSAVEEHILPGNTTRVILPLKRVYLENPHAYIPSLNPANQRQFVVSSKISPEVEKANREAFWYREHILESLKGTWESEAGMIRSGTIELRSMRLTSRMIEAIKVDDVGIDISIDDPNAEEEDGSDSDGSATTEKKKIFAEEFVQLRVRVSNRTDQPIYPFVRIMPALCHRPLNVALDFTRKFAWNGTLQRPLPLLAAHSSADTVFGVTALCRGEFEITASVEETKLWTPDPSDEVSLAKRKQSDTETLMNAALGAKERRIWHSRQPCHIVVRDRE